MSPGTKSRRTLLFKINITPIIEHSAFLQFELKYITNFILSSSLPIHEMPNNYFILQNNYFFFYRKFGLMFLTILLNNKFNTMWRWTLTSLTPIKKHLPSIPFWNSHELHAYKNNGNSRILAPFITLKDAWATCCINLSIITLY